MIRSIRTLGSTGGAPIADGITRGILAAAIIELLDLAGVDAVVVQDHPTLILLASFFAWAVYDEIRRRAGNRSETIGAAPASPPVDDPGTEIMEGRP